MISCLRDGNALNMDFKWLILDAFLHSIIRFPLELQLASLFHSISHPFHSFHPFNTIVSSLKHPN